MNDMLSVEKKSGEIYSWGVIRHKLKIIMLTISTLKKGKIKNFSKR